MSPALPSVRALAPGDPLADDRLLRELGQRYLVWDAFVGGERRVDLHPIVLPGALHRRAVRVAESVARTVDRVAARALVDPRERARYAFHDDVLGLAMASHEGGDVASLARVDLLLTERAGSPGLDFVACEVNADCPGGLNEALALPALAREVGFVAGRDPTRVVDRLAARLVTLARGEAIALLFATAYAEDLQICALVARAIEKRGGVALLAPPTAPRRDGDGLAVFGRRVGALYRFFPTEYMEGQRNLDDIAAAVASGHVRTLANFAQIFPQSKLAMARVTALEGADEEPGLPETHALLDVPEARLREERASWVVKRALGRVGDQVFVGKLFRERDFAQMLVETRALAAEGEPWIAQRFVPQVPIATPLGPRYLTLGAYVLDGVFAGYFARVTPDTHVSHDALCLPVFVDEGAS